MSKLKRIVRLVKPIPLVGPLCDTSMRDHREASIEVAISIFLSTIPIWFGSLLLLADTGRSLTFVEYLYENVRDGEILLICSALTSPLLYFIFVHGKDLAVFPAARSLMLSVVAILIVSVGLFAFQRAESLFATGGRVDKDFVFELSVITFAYAVLVSYLATCYRNWRASDAAAYQQSETARFVDKFNQQKESEK